MAVTDRTVDVAPAASKEAGGSGRRLLRSLASGRLADWVQPAALFVVVLAAWQYGISRIVPSYLVPKPTQIATSLWDGYVHEDFLHHTWVTFQEIVLGFGCGVALGMGLGVLLAQSRLADRLLSPYVITLNAMPKVAVAPLFVVWFGYGLVSKLIVTALVAFFPLLINVSAGLRAVSTEQVELMRSLNASRWQTFTKLQLRNGLPQIFAGLEIAMVLAVVGAIVGEFVGAQEGLGYVLQLSLSQVNPPDMFAMLIILAVISWVLYQVVHVAGRRIVFWEHSNRYVESA